ncbi:MAG: T9SS type A sorting domain-containing protein [Bacteroidetes bacterium]|nr:T9SS type A sorting domain-containing protein [Bacteroidota bacterium]
MKKLILISLLSILTLTSFSQPYKSVFGKKSTVWLQLYVIIDAGNFVDSFTAGSDTIIKSKSYKKILITGHRGGLGFLREDTLTGRLWYKSIKDTSEKLIMDLSLKLNDSFLISGYHPSTKGVVKSIYSKNGMKNIILNYTVWSSSYTLHFIEGIGPTSGLDYQQNIYDNTLSKLRCKFMDSIHVYADTADGKPCYFIETSVQEKLKTHQSISIYPNPVIRGGDFRIKNSGVLLSIKLLDIFGKEIIFKNVKDDVLELPEFIPSGIYFLKMENSKGETSTLKLFVK